ncbi:MAG: aldo/keto reductase [Clostridia bacterium]|nr:aldo/keto reductase [Clostridia bacterium]
MFDNKFFPEIKGNFGFGCMRLPMKDGEVDYEEFKAMADSFIAEGFNYFDTAHGYIGGKSETAIRDCVSKRFKRSEFLLTNKLSEPYFNSQEDIIPFFKSQLELCGVDYFDFYLMHAQNANNYKKYKAFHAYETAFELKKQGYIKHVGLSFHDSADVLDMILRENPQVEAVQIQLNYVDFDDPQVQSEKCYNVCLKHGKPCIIMEPVKGGTLANLPLDAANVLKALSNDSNASYAVRYAASFPNVMMVLSGMSDMNQMNDNLKTMVNFKAVTGEEEEALKKVVYILRNRKLIPCTGCRYCVEQNSCPMNIRIPDIFALRNHYDNFKGWLPLLKYKNELTAGEYGKASDCIKCGMCEEACPQHLEIRSLLEEAASVFEK